jgi:hypothetical protein
MAGGNAFKDGPAYIGGVAADLFVPAASTVYALVRQIHIVNTSDSAKTVQLFIGSTGGSAGGTEIMDESVPANSSVDKFFPSGLKLTSTQFLSGLAGTTSAVTCTIAGELYATPI